MATKKKSWAEKMEEANKKGGIRKKTDKGMMYISTPKELATYIKKVPKGKLTSTKQLIGKLNKKYKVDFTCPLTTGIFVSVLANVAEEEMAMGKKQKDVIPYWRVIKEPKGYLYEKYLTHKHPQKKYLEAEGHKVIPSGTKKGPVVKDYEEKLI